MDLADTSRRPTAGEFEAEALRFLPNVARYARLLARDPADADDLTQETFLRAYRSWSTFRPGTDCRKWLFAICRNTFLRDRRRATRFLPADDPEVELRATREVYFQAVAGGLGGLFDRIDLRPAIERALQALIPEYRDVAILVDVEGCSYAEVAATLDVPIGTVRSRLYRARRQLQQSLLEHAHDLGFGRSRDTSGAGEETIT